MTLSERPRFTELVCSPQVSKETGVGVEDCKPRAP